MNLLDEESITFESHSDSRTSAHGRGGEDARRPGFLSTLIVDQSGTGFFLHQIFPSPYPHPPHVHLTLETNHTQKKYQNVSLVGTWAAQGAPGGLVDPEASRLFWPASTRPWRPSLPPRRPTARSFRLPWRLRRVVGRRMRTSHRAWGWGKAF